MTQSQQEIGHIMEFLGVFLFYGLVLTIAVSILLTFLADEMSSAFYFVFDSVTRLLSYRG